MLTLCTLPVLRWPSLAVLALYLTASCHPAAALLAAQWLPPPCNCALQVNYFAFVAEEVRIGLASLGMRSLDELVGRADLLKQSVTKLPKTEGLDLSFLTTFAGKSGSSNQRRGQEVGSVL